MGKPAIREILDELDALLMKKADEANMTTSFGQEDSGPKATSGAGKDAKDPSETHEDLDQDSPNITQTDDGSKSTAYQTTAMAGLPGESEKHDEAVSSDSVDKAAQIANRILKKVSALLSKKAAPKKVDKKAQAEKAAGAKLAEQTILSLLKKKAADESEEKSEKEDDSEGGSVPEGLREYAEGEKSEKSEEKKAYLMSKRAGEKAAEEFLANLAQLQQTELTKQAAVQDYLMSKEAGKRAAEELLQKAAAEQQLQALAAQQLAANQNPYLAAMQKQAAEQDYFLSKQAGAKLAEDTILALANLALQKQAADLVAVNPILSGLLADGDISEEEKSAIVNYLSSASYLDENAIDEATEGVGNQDSVREALKKVMQANTTPAPSPVPEMPQTQPSQPAADVSESKDVSEAGGEVGDNLDQMIVSAALKSMLNTMDKAAKQTKKTKRA